ncbi:MAG: hypothetical protein FJ315_09295, partial [SAR202 cluster bacterium]|nr:hypothetical protein [SAR202 cluster bacterium]
ATASTYSRGALAGDPVFTSLHLSILNAISLQVTGLPGGQPSYLADLGITFDSTQKGSVTDATKLNDFLSKNPTHAEQVFNSANGIATKLVALLDPYAQTGGIVDETVTVLGNQKRSLDLRVLSLQERLSVRERQIRSQLSSMQGVLVGLAQQQSILGATLGFLSNAGR